MPRPTDFQTFARAWPPSPDGILPGGDRLGFLRYLTRDPASPLRVNVPKSRWVMLDPSVTAPNATVGVSFDPSNTRSRWNVLMPGDVLYAPADFYEFWIYNADMLDRIDSGLPAAGLRPVGYCGFLVGQGPPPERSGGPLPFARLCGVGRLVSGLLIIPVGNLRTMIVELLPIDAGGALVSASSWSARLQVTPYSRVPVGAMSATGMDSETADDPTAGGSARQSEYSYVGGTPGNDMVEIVARGAHYLQFQVSIATLSTWAGVAVADLHAQIEGIGP